MHTKLYKFKSKKGSFNIIAPDDLEFPSFDYEWYEKVTACGAGTGIGDAVVPESVLFVRIALACYIHDDMFDRSEKTWQAFRHANSVFLFNIISIIQNQSAKNKFNPLKHLRMYRAATYYNAVDAFGHTFFNK